MACFEFKRGQLFRYTSKQRRSRFSKNTRRLSGAVFLREPQGIEQICHFIRPAEGDAMHFSGSERCGIVRRCYGNKKLW